MRLRKTLDSLKAQNWIAVFLDFVLVVIGVYLGMMLSNAQGQAHTADRAKASLSLLLEDVTNSVERLAYVSNAQEARIAALQRVTDALGSAEFSEEAVAKDVEFATRNNPTMLARDTVYTAMVQDDELYSLPADLQSLIAQTYAADFKFLTVATMQYWNNQDAVRVGCIDQYWNMDGKKLISRAPEDVARLRNCFVNLRDYSAYYLTRTSDVHRVNPEKLKAALEARLGVTPSGPAKPGAASPPAN